MKKNSNKKLRSLVTLNKVTIFIAKLFGMISKFQNGEYVCLKHDKSKKFYVVSNVIIDGKIKLGYFNADKSIIDEDIDIEPSKLEYSLEEVYRRYKELKDGF
ncbi:hypothetical protein [Phocaeicola sartorii]|jgi:hypothetical protein|uniref:hypothetical protein n=1 Tax=Phocaeicola sartorii TaxID=671267 RepID=UPI0035190786